MWVIEDVEKHEWSKYDYTFLEHVKDLNVNDAKQLKSGPYITTKKP